MKPTVYIETTIVSYLTAWPSRDLVRAAQQQITREWWRTSRVRFELVTSELVVIEAAAGDADASRDRLLVVDAVPVLEVSEAATVISKALLQAGAIPQSASRDALHVGICAANGIDFLLTWNFRHLANAVLKNKISDTCEASGFRPPVICTPEELSEEI